MESNLYHESGPFFKECIGVDEPHHTWECGKQRVKEPNKMGDTRFHAILKEISDLHDRKSSDYATEADPYANIRGASDWGIPQWVGAMIRATDKVKRLQKYARTGSLTNESAEDAFMDLAVYALIALVLHREGRE
mgnify:CR=1 FL=1